MFPPRPTLRQQPIMLILFALSIGLNLVLAVLVHNMPSAPDVVAVRLDASPTVGYMKDVTVAQTRAPSGHVPCSKRLDPVEHPLIACDRAAINH